MPVIFTNTSIKLQESEKGKSVGLLEVFERTHTKDSPKGKQYVNTRAQRTAVTPLLCLDMSVHNHPFRQQPNIEVPNN